MRFNARLAGLACCLLVLLTTCSAPIPRREEAAISGFTAASTQVISPTPLPTVIPQPEATPGPSDSAKPPLASVMVPVSTPSPELAIRAVRMDSYLRSLTDQGFFSGSVLVAYRGSLLVSQGYGMANREEGIPAAAETRYRLASVTKTITALAVLRLVAEGKVDLDASICSYVRSCPATWQAIAVWHLLHQSSGIANFTDFADFPSYEQTPSTPEQLVARFRYLPLGFTPGTVYHYTNSNYLLLGLIIEAASGQPYADYLRDEIFLPLGMLNSGVDPGDFSPLNGTRGYLGAALDIPLDVSNLFAAGDVYSTIGDLYLLARAFEAGALLPADLAAAMVEPKPGRYAMGWVVQQRDGQRVIYHPGSMSGAATWFGRYPDAELTIIVLSNLTNANAIAIADALAGLALN
jgi:CubicO group peptidase (beta-lactamase class C family)